ncbi:N-acetylglucosaminyl-diphospho-decaprenol L-rhamnosyltransferase [Myxococcaceae bacterium]|nr:N-acetylglucosaminyl-diphospho-decaprenol L-rhamnosyltransferase [Myxococcaceae bacterium]
MDLSILIVTWNSAAEIGACLRSLRERLEGRISFETIVIDNASSDSTVEVVKRVAPDAHLIETGTNEGFGRACNRGIAEASGRRILLLNPDCEVGEGLPELLAWLDANPRVGIATGWIVGSDGRIQRNWGRTPPSLWTEILEHTTLAKLAPSIFGRHWLGVGDSREIRFVPAISGMAMILDSKLARDLGGFDPAYFMYLEDFDLCWRAREHGAAIARNPVATILHHGDRSAARVGDASVARSWPYQSMYLFLRRHRSRLQAEAFLWLVRLGLAMRLAVSRLQSRLGGADSTSKQAEYRGILRRLGSWDRATMGPAEEAA